VLSKLEGGQWALENIPAEYYGIIKAALIEYESGSPAQYDETEAINYAKFMLGLIF
jgi:streptomycin 3"-adenylyltransferase